MILLGGAIEAVVSFAAVHAASRRAASALRGDAGVSEDDQTGRQSDDASRTCEQCDSD